MDNFFKLIKIEILDFPSETLKGRLYLQLFAKVDYF